MKFDRPQMVSFKAVDDGSYVGVIVGFAYVGIHSTKEWGDKQKVMLRWELHDLNSPHDVCKDDESLIHVVAQVFPATIRGDSSWLYKCLLAHGIVIPGGECADSKDWYGRAAILAIEGATGSRGDRVFMNVVGINSLDQNVNIKPMLNYEHWEAEDENPPPIWARFMVERSNDIYERANQVKGAPAGGAVKPTQPTRRQPAASQGTYTPPSQSHYTPIDTGDDEDIPFRYRRVDIII